MASLDDQALSTREEFLTYMLMSGHIKWEVSEQYLWSWSVSRSSIHVYGLLA